MRAIQAGQSALLSKLQGDADRVRARRSSATHDPRGGREDPLDGIFAPEIGARVDPPVALPTTLPPSPLVSVVGARWGIDPRPDLDGDSRAWVALLALARAHDGAEPRGVFGGLHYLRCLGARLQSGARGLRIAAGEIDAREYAEARQELLLPRAALVAGWLRQIEATDDAGWVTA